MSNTADTCVELRSDDDVLLDYLCYTAYQAEVGVRIGEGTVPWIIEPT